jgi:hypothetical protein
VEVESEAFEPATGSKCLLGPLDERGRHALLLDRANGLDDDPLAIGDEPQIGLACDVEEPKYWLLDHDGVAVSERDEVLRLWHSSRLIDRSDGFSDSTPSPADSYVRT